MPCIVVTRNGEGDVWAFPGMRAARLHPVPQMTDVYAANGDQLVAQYGRAAVRSLLRFVPQGDRGACDALLLKARWTPEDFSRYAGLVWPHVEKASKRPPELADEIVAVVRADRLALENVVLRSFDAPQTEQEAPRRSSPNQTGEEDMTERNHFRMSDQGVVSLAKDDKGVLFGAENNPMKGEAKQKLFAEIKDGMTVEELLAVDGVDRSFVRRARRAGYIDIVNPPEEPKAEGEADESAKKSRKGKKADATAAAETSGETAGEASGEAAEA